MWANSYNGAAASGGLGTDGQGFAESVTSAGTASVAAVRAPSRRTMITAMDCAASSVPRSADQATKPQKKNMTKKLLSRKQSKISTWILSKNPRVDGLRLIL